MKLHDFLQIEGPDRSVKKPNEYRTGLPINRSGMASSKGSAGSCRQVHTRRPQHMLRFFLTGPVRSLSAKERPARPVPSGPGPAD
jgi:hypothetical protein